MPPGSSGSCSELMMAEERSIPLDEGCSDILDAIQYDERQSDC